MAQRDGSRALEAVDHGARFGHCHARQLAALQVDGFQLVGETLGGGCVFLEQQRDRQLRLRDATGGVDPRRDAVRQVSSCHVLRRLAGAGKQRSEPGALRIGQVRQAQANDRPALARHRRQVGHGPDGRHGSQVRRHRTPARQQRGRELVGQAGAGQVWIGIGAIGPMRIHHRHGARQGPGRQVVIGHDHVQSQAARMRDLGHVHDSAVTRDDEGHAGSRQALEAGIRQPVALRQPRRNVADRLRAQRPQRDRPDHDRGHAVRVVVTPDGDPFAVVQCPLQPRERDVGIGHEAGVVQRLAAGVQEGGELRIVAEAAARQERGDRSTEARERGRIEERLRQMPLQARSDHAAMVAARHLSQPYEPVIGEGAEHVSG